MYIKYSFISIILVCLMMSGCGKSPQKLNSLNLEGLDLENLSKIEFERTVTSNSQLKDELVELENLDEFVKFTNIALNYMQSEVKSDEDLDFIIEKLSPNMTPENVQYFIEILGELKSSEESLFIPVFSGGDALLSEHYKSQLVRLKEYYRILDANSETLEELVTEFIADSIEGRTAEEVEDMRAWARDVLKDEFDEMPEDLAALGLTVEELELLIQETLEQEAQVEQNSFERLKTLSKTDSRFILKADGIYVNVAKLTEAITVEFEGFEYSVEPIINEVVINPDSEFKLVSCKGALNRVAVRYADVEQNMYLDFKFKVLDSGEIENVDIRVSSVEVFKRELVSPIGNFVVYTSGDTRITDIIEKAYFDHLSKSTVVDITDSISNFMGEWDIWGDREYILTAYLFGDLDSKVKVVGTSLQDIRAYVDLLDIFEFNSEPYIYIGGQVISLNDSVKEMWRELQFFVSEVELVSYNVFDNGYFRAAYRSKQLSNMEIVKEAYDIVTLEVRIFFDLKTGTVLNSEYVLW